MTDASLEIDVADASARLDAGDAEWLVEHIELVGNILGLRGSIRVKAVDDHAMRSAHREFLGEDSTTDVITFDLSDPDPERPEKPTPEHLCSENKGLMFGIDADILVCVDEASRQSHVGGYPMTRELLLYVVHGVLHCLGWDDHDEKEAEAMHRMEDAVLHQVGVGPVYHRRDL